MTGMTERLHVILPPTPQPLVPLAAFSLALNHIVAARLDMHDPKSMIITGVYRDPNGAF